MGSSLVIGTTNWVLVGKTVLSVAGTSITVSGIPTTYSMLFVIFNGRLAAAGSEDLQITFNGDGANNYHYQRTIFPVGVGASETTHYDAGFTRGARIRNVADGFVEMWILPTGTKNFTSRGGEEDQPYIAAGYYGGASDISSITVTTVGNMIIGSFLAVYGVI